MHINQKIINGRFKPVYTLQDAISFAEKQNLEWLDDCLIDAKHKHNLKCKTCKKIWKKTLSSLIYNHSCSYCAKAMGLEEIDKNCSIFNLKYLNNIPRGISEISDFECLVCGFVFRDLFRNVFRHSEAKIELDKNYSNIKCKKCAGNYMINYFDKIVEAHINMETGIKAKLLTREFTIKKNSYILMCEFGHTWETSLSAIELGHWCSHCSNRAKLTIDVPQNLAKERGGKLLSTEYLGSGAIYDWECNVGCHFKATYNKVQQGRWCPNHGKSIAERITRLYFETLFDNKFPNTKIDWLINSRGNIMELDGYCSTLNLAFEHNGEQHYKKVLKFKMTDADLKQRMLDDDFKIKLCKEKNINLIVIPQLFDKLEIKDLKGFIKNECLKQNIKLPMNFDNIEINYNSVYINNYALEQMKILQDNASKHEGEILSDKYINSTFLVICRCKNGNVWESYATAIKCGYWCPGKCCNPTSRNDLIDIINFANSIDLNCLSKNYTNQHMDLDLICKANNHKFIRSYKQLKRFPYCPRCRKTRWTIEDMKIFAINKNGECLSNNYINNKNKLTWKCNICENIWEATPANILGGSWCPKCQNHNRIIVPAL